MAAPRIDLDRAGKTPLAVQIYGAIRSAIETGRLASGARLPSWRDLAAQLGVSRGTVRVAYQRLIDEPFRSHGRGPAEAALPVTSRVLMMGRGARLRACLPPRRQSRIARRSDVGRPH